MKILHVIRDLDPVTGGPVSAVSGLVAAQTQTGHDVDVVATDYGIVTHPNLDASVTLCRCIVGQWRYAPKMKSVLVKKIKDAEIIHVHTMWEYPTLLATNISKSLGKPCIVRPCGMLDKWSLSQSSLKKKLYLKTFSRSLFHSKCILHFTTESEREKSYRPGHLGSFVVENGISPHAFSEEAESLEFYRMYPHLMNKKIVLFLGRVNSKKQPNILIQAFSMMASIFPDLHLVISGPGNMDYIAKLKKQVDKLGIKSRVSFTGMLSGSLLYATYRAAFVFVLPSLQENFGISVAEAMAGACPVIISDQVDIKDVVECADAGIICTANVDGVVSSLKSILDSSRRAKKMGENGRKVALDKFTWKNIADRLDEVYVSILK